MHTEFENTSVTNNILIFLLKAPQIVRNLTSGKEASKVKKVRLNSLKKSDYVSINVEGSLV